MSKKETIVLPSNGKEIELPELSTEQVLQLIRLAKSVLRKVPDLLETIEEARFAYMKEQAQGFVSKSYFEGLEDEEKEQVEAKLNQDFTQWTFFEDLSEEDQDALSALGITAETLKKDPIQFSFPSSVPMAATLAKVFPDIYDACSQEIIMACAVVLINPGRLEKAVKTNTVEDQLLDYRTELTSKLAPKDFIHLAAKVTAYVLKELRELGGELGKVLTDIQDQLVALAGQQSEKSPENQSENETIESSEKSEPASSSNSAETTTGLV